MDVHLKSYRLWPFNIHIFFAVWISFTSCVLLVISACYVSIWIKSKFGRHSQHHVTSVQDRKLTVSLFLVTVVSVVTWLSTNSIFIASWFEFRCIKPLIHLQQIKSHALFITVALLRNPIIYSFRMPRFRQVTVRLVCRRSSKRREEAIQVRNVRHTPHVGHTWSPFLSEYNWFQRNVYWEQNVDSHKPNSYTLLDIVSRERTKFLLVNLACSR